MALNVTPNYFLVETINVMASIYMVFEHVLEFLPPFITVMQRLRTKVLHNQSPIINPEVPRTRVCLHGKLCLLLSAILIDFYGIRFVNKKTV